TEDVDLTLKVCFLGDSAVGKTSLIKRYVYDIFGDKYLMTMGTKVTKKNVEIVMPEYDKEFKLNFMIWDIIGDIHFRGLLHHSYLFGAAGALIVCDLTRRETLEGLTTWVESLHAEGDGNIPILFMVNKSDLTDDKKFDEADIERFSKIYNSPYLLTSAKTGANVEEAFKILGEKMIKKHWKETEST
ncbi:MAG: GTP-binding protein, partial [Methanomassiliicoccales archaeon]